MKYEFHPEAEDEFLEAAAHYESEVPGLGDRFGDEVERVVSLLLEHPELGALSHSVTTTLQISCFSVFGAETVVGRRSEAAYP